MNTFMFNNNMKSKIMNERVEVFTAITVKVLVFQVVMPYNDMIVYQHFRGPCCLHLHLTLKMKAEWSPEVLVPYHVTT